MSAAEPAGAAASPGSSDGEDGAAEPLDALIIGGGPAGLSAAIWLGCYHRSVALLDLGEPRNRPTWAVHGFPGLPEVPPLTLRARLREQAEQAGARIRTGSAQRVLGARDAFLTETSEGPLRSRRVLLAFGRKDVIPDIPGIEEAYGTSVFHCPDCDGPAMLGRDVGVVGGDRAAAALALFLRPWARRLVLLPRPGDEPLDEPARAALARERIEVRPGRVARLESTSGRLRRVILDDGAADVSALFFHSGTFPACEIGADLGCEQDRGGHIGVDRGQETSVRGVYAAGDVTGHPYLAAIAAAEGIRAALAIHRSLLPEGLEL